MNKKIYKMSKNELQYLYDNSSSYSEILRKTNSNEKGGGGRRATIKRYEIIHNIDKSQFLINYEIAKSARMKKFAEYAKASGSIRKVDLKMIMTDKSSYSGKSLKRRIMSENIIEYKCSGCGNKGIWQNKDLSLQLDHINGIKTDNRLDNLRFLCPNCHTQTPTYGSKKEGGKKEKEKDREKSKKAEIEKKNKIENRKKSLEKINMKRFGWVRDVSKMWDVSHSQVKRWVDNYYPNIERFSKRSVGVNG